MYRVLLVSLNRETVPYPVFPVGVWTLAQYLSRHTEVQVDVADPLIADDPGPWLTPFLQKKPYDLVGLALRNIDNLSWPESISYLPDIRQTVLEIKRHYPLEQVVVGGAGYSIFGQPLLDELGLRHGVSGAGEQRLLARLTGRPPEQCPAPDFGFARAVPGQVLRHYYKLSGMIGIQTRRGCAYNCSYCTYPQIEGHHFQLRDIKKVIREMQDIQERAGAEVFYFVDSLFNAPRDYTLALLRALAEAPLFFRWYAFVSPGGFDDEMAQAMKAAGCRGIEFGSESGSDIILQSLGKHFTAQQVVQASQCCCRAGIPFCHYLALGAPEETLGTVAESVACMERCEPNTVIVSIGIRLYPNTPLAHRRIREGRLVATDPLLEPRFIEPDEISLPAIRDYCKRSCPSHWVYPGMQVSLHLEQMRYMRERGLKGPLWDYI